MLAQLPGVNILAALTVLAAIGTIERFQDAKHLVGYAGLGTRVHDSGQTHQNGRITKTGRKDLRQAITNEIIGVVEVGAVAAVGAAHT